MFVLLNRSRESYLSLMHCPIATRNSFTVFSPPTSWSHNVFSLFWWLVFFILLLFLGWIPCWCCRFSVSVWATSFFRLVMTVHSDGLALPTRCLNPLFHDSQMLLVRWFPLRVTSWTFHTCGGNLGGVLRNLITPSVATHRKDPDTYVWSKWSVLPVLLLAGQSSLQSPCRQEGMLDHLASQQTYGSHHLPCRQPGGRQLAVFARYSVSGGRSTLGYGCPVSALIAPRCVCQSQSQQRFGALPLFWRWTIFFKFSLLPIAARTSTGHFTSLSATICPGWPR